VAHDARIEQGRRLERVFVQKISPDQAALRLGEYGVRLECLLHLGGACLEDIEQVPVAAVEVFKHIGQLPGRGFGLQPENPMKILLRVEKGRYGSPVICPPD
jgi:hypothetical protein